MGSSQSQASKSKNGAQDGRSEPPSPDEKHNSANSTEPLASHAANFTFPRSSSVDRHRSIATTDSRARTLSITDEDDIQPATPTSNSPVEKVKIDATEGHSNVSRPPPPPRLRRLSELIDPEQVPFDSHVRTPSGNLLALEQFLVHPDRPRSIRERQETIRERVRAASRLGEPWVEREPPMPVAAGQYWVEGEGEGRGGEVDGKCRWWRCGGGCFSEG